MKRVLITGGSGLVGKRLSEILKKTDYDVRWLGRKNPDDMNSHRFFWDWENKVIDVYTFENVDAVVHLAGAGISGERWSDEYKKKIWDSREQGTSFLIDTLKKAHQPKVVIAASAIGFYGNRGDELLDETSGPQEDNYLSDLVQAWENQSMRFQTEMDIRTCILRIGLVMSRKGGFLKEMKDISKYGILSRLGSGKQWMSWIQIDDLCNMIKHCIENESTTGTYNAVGPIPVQNKLMTKGINKVLRKPGFAPPVPLFALKAVLGEFAEHAVASQRCKNEKIQETGFRFKHGILIDALEKSLLH